MADCISLIEINDNGASVVPFTPPQPVNGELNVPSPSKRLESNRPTTPDADTPVSRPIQPTGERDRSGAGRMGEPVGTERTEQPDRNPVSDPRPTPEGTGGDQRMAESATSGRSTATQTSPTGTTQPRVNFNEIEGDTENDVLFESANDYSKRQTTSPSLITDPYVKSLASRSSSFNPYDMERVFNEIRPDYTDHPDYGVGNFAQLAQWLWLRAPDERYKAIAALLIQASQTTTGRVPVKIAENNSNQATKAAAYVSFYGRPTRIEDILTEYSDKNVVEGVFLIREKNKPVFNYFMAMHEAVHVVTYHALRDKAYRQEAKRLYKLARKTIKTDKWYGLTDVDEFFAEALSNNEFQQVLDTIPDPQANRSLWTSFVELIKTALNKIWGKTSPTGSLLDSTLQLTEKIVDEFIVKINKPTHPDQIKQVLAKKLGSQRLDFLLKTKKLIINQNNSLNRTTRGTYRNGVVTLYSDAIQSGQEWAAFVHVAGGSPSLESILGKDKALDLTNRFNARSMRHATERGLQVTNQVIDFERLQATLNWWLLDSRLFSYIRARVFAVLPRSLSQHIPLLPQDIWLLTQLAAKDWANTAKTGEESLDQSNDFIPERRSSEEIIAEALAQNGFNQNTKASRGSVSGQSSTPTLIKQVLADKLGAKRLELLLKQGKLLISEDAPTNGIQGKYENGVVTLYPANIQQGQEWGVFLHEAGEHASLPTMLGDKYAQVVKQFNNLVSKQNPDAIRALERVPEDTPTEHLDSERLAYLIEDQANKTGAAKFLINRVLALVKAWAFAKLPTWLTRYMNLSPADIAALATRSAKAWADNKVQSTRTTMPQYSQASDQTQDNLWAEIDKDLPKEGLERGKELLSKGWQWAKDNTKEFVQSGGLGLITLRQLAEISESTVPSVKKYMTRVERMLTQRNQMMDEAAKLAQRWQKLDKRVKHRLSSVMHMATLNKVDPSLDAAPTPKVSIRVADIEWREKLGLPRIGLGTELTSSEIEVTDKTLKLLNQRYQEAKNKARNFKGGREKFEQLQEIANNLQEDWRLAKAAQINAKAAAAHYPQLRQLFLGLPHEARDIFTESRDLYESRFTRKQNALLRAIELSEFSEAQKQSMSSQLRHEFESAKLQGVYFPLHRQGKYFVRAMRQRDDLAGGVKTYSKSVKGNAGKINEVLARESGVMQWQIESDGRIFNLREDAEAALGTWMSEEAALASANSRQDLIGKRLVAVPAPDGKGFVLQDDPFEPVFMMFPTAAEAQRVGEKLRDGQHKDIKVGVLNKDNTADEMARASILMQTMGQMKKQGQNVPDQMYQLMLEMLPELSMRKNAIHRKGIAGFSEDALNAFGHQMMHQAHQISKLEAREDLALLLDNVGQEVKSAPQSKAVFAGQVLTELKKRNDWVMNPSNAAWTNWTSSFGFVMYLGFSPAAALVNLSQVAVVGYPTLAATHGWAKAGAELRKAAALMNVKETVMGEDALSRDRLTEDEKAAFERWHDEGVIDKTNAQMLAGVADNDALSNSPAYQKAMGKVAHLFHKAEILNREVMLLAGYRLARQAGKTHQQAIEYASQATWESQFDYSNANRARFMQNDAAKVFLMFKSYSQHMIYFLLRNARQWGKGGAEAKAAKTKLLGILGMTMALGGLSALPIGMVGAATAFTYAQAKFGTQKAVLGTAGAALGLMALAAATLDDDEDWETETRAFLRSTGGDWLETLVFRGGVNLATGVDLSARISLDDLLIRDPSRELEGKDLAAHYVQQALGPVVGYGINALGTAPQLWADDHGGRALETLAPKFMRDWMQATRFGYEGVLNMRGDSIVDTDLLSFGEELNLWNIFWKLNGFNSEKVARQYQQNNDIKNYEQRALSRRQRILSRYYAAYIERDREGMQEATEAAREWNQRYPKGKPLDAAAFKRSVATRERYSRESQNGVNVSKNLRFLNGELGIE